MGKKARYTLFILLVIVVLIFAGIEIRDFWLQIGKPLIPKPQDPLRDDLAEMIALYEDQKISSIDISAMTEFSWDRLYVFGPYTSRREIQSVTGRAFSTACFTQIASLENSVLLMFTRDGKAVHCLDYPMGKNDFASVYLHTSGFAEDEATFIVDENGKFVWAGDR